MIRFKKQILILVSVFAGSFLLAGCTPSNEFYYAYDRGDCYTQKFDNSDDRLDLNFEWKKDSLWLNWDEYTDNDFEGYYLLRENNEECPYYYIGRDYFEYIGRSSLTYYQDKDVTSGQTYRYRVCVKTLDKSIDCGGVKKIEIY